MTQHNMIHLLVTHHDELVNYIHKRFGNRSFAHEVIQETCVRLLTKTTPSFDQGIAPVALLKRMSLHLAIDLYRKDQLNQRFFAMSMDVSEYTEAENPKSLTLPELCLAKQQYEQQLIVAIQTLPLVCQDVFILTQLYHLSQVETAAQMGISRGMVGKHLMRALTHLIPVLFEQELPHENPTATTD